MGSGSAAGPPWSRPGLAVPVLALFAVAVVTANIQGAAAPFASPLPLIVGTPDASLAGPLTQARQQLAGSHRTSGYTPPALDAMISDFARYHTAFSALSSLIVLVVLVANMGTAADPAPALLAFLNGGA